jgi:hypothetical protein
LDIAKSDTAAYPLRVKKFNLILFCAFFGFLSALTPKEALAMDPKVKVVGATALYGTVGGALLGTASLAFGAKGRSVAIGASLGLYAGLLFGTYVVVTHSMKQKGYFQENPNDPLQRDNYYPNSEEATPYRPGNDGGGIFDGFFQRSMQLHELSVIDHERRGNVDRMLSGRPDLNIFNVELVRFQF